MRFQKLTLLSFFCVLGLLSACTTSSTGRNKVAFISSDKLNEMGTLSFEELKKTESINKDISINRYVQCVANTILPYVPQGVYEGEWEVVVFESEQVNAFALPGGKIGVYTGILSVANTQEQLAAIVGHEIAHVIEEHSNERLSSNQISSIGLGITDLILQQQNIGYRDELMTGLNLGIQHGILMPYSRSHESEADIIGQELMAKSGFNPKASITLWQNMAKVSGKQPAEFLSTHPSHETRINALTKHLSVSNVLYQQQKRKARCVQ